MWVDTGPPEYEAVPATSRMRNLELRSNVVFIVTLFYDNKKKTRMKLIKKYEIKAT
jgi:hypothetical protein